MMLVCVTQCSYASTMTDATTLAVATQNLPLFMQPLVQPALFVLMSDNREIVETQGEKSLLKRILPEKSLSKTEPVELANWLDRKFIFMTIITQI